MKAVRFNLFLVLAFVIFGCANTSEDLKRDYPEAFSSDKTLSGSLQEHSDFTGMVLFPDGRPAPGVKVEANAFCDGDIRMHSTHHTTTDSEGRFKFRQWQMFSKDQSGILPFWTEITFSAMDENNYWLKSGYNSFLDHPNGTAPVIHKTDKAPYIEIFIKLKERGGAVAISIWDTCQNKHIGYSLYVERVDEPGSDGGFIYSKKPSKPFLLPEGHYKAEISSFDCHGISYSTQDSPQFLFEVIEGETSEVNFNVDFSQFEVEREHGNPTGKKCHPCGR